LEKNRIYHAAAGCILIILSPVSIAAAQESSPGDTLNIKNEEEVSDTLSGGAVEDTSDISIDDIFEEGARDSIFIDKDSSISEIAPPPDSLRIEAAYPTIYHSRTYLARGTADELKSRPAIFIQNGGPVGSPRIPLRYLNAPGIEININRHPFLYNDIYRPYAIGSDLGAIPWEILNEIHWNNERSLDNRLHFDLGRPPDDENRSDVEVSRGPYGYSSSRWRFFRPFTETTYGYFTLGFKKGNGYLANTDYDIYHVTGGGSYYLFGGLLRADAWKYRAKAGVNTFHYLTPQIFRHSRTTKRYEVTYSRDVKSLFNMTASGIYQKNGLIISDFFSSRGIDSDLGGGSLEIGRKTRFGDAVLGVNYYRLRTYKLEGVKPAVNIFDYSAKINADNQKLAYKIDLAYSWSRIDHGSFLSGTYLRYNIYPVIKPFVSVSRSRRTPDLNLLYFNEEVSGLGLPGILESYRFESSRNLNSPVTSRLTAGVESDIGWTTLKVQASYMKIKDQIYLSFAGDTLGGWTVSPVNFDDRLMEIQGEAAFRLGPFDGELGGSFRRWPDRYFVDGLEKGPAATGFGRISALRSFFFKDLFLGGSLELRGSSRRDYRSIQVGLADGFWVINGRLEFRYKDFIFWWNDDNITNNNYATWWPYPETPRTLWWGFRWRFYD
jgi:hypothetical protein